MRILILFLSIFASSCCYRAGGMSKESEANPKWIPKWLRKSWVRDWLCPLFVYGYFCALLLPYHFLQWSMLVICYGLLGGALSTYWDELFGDDNFYFAGFMCGVASFPLMFTGTSWIAILARAILLGILWGLWCNFNDNDVIEEMGRGAFLVLTVPLLLV